MQAAAKAARTEMMQRVRENKAGQGERGSGPAATDAATAAGVDPQGPRGHAEWSWWRTSAPTRKVRVAHKATDTVAAARFATRALG
jgi:hypothetical protein